MRSPPPTPRRSCQPADERGIFPPSPTLPTRAHARTRARAHARTHARTTTGPMHPMCALNPPSLHECCAGVECAALCGRQCAHGDDTGATGAGRGQILARLLRRFPHGFSSHPHRLACVVVRARSCAFCWCACCVMSAGACHMRGRARSAARLFLRPGAALQRCGCRVHACARACRRAWRACVVRRTKPCAILTWTTPRSRSDAVRFALEPTPLEPVPRCTQGGRERAREGGRKGGRGERKGREKDGGRETDGRLLGRARMTGECSMNALDESCAKDTLIHGRKTH